MDSVIKATSKWCGIALMCESYLALRLAEHKPGLQFTRGYDYLGRACADP